MTSSRVGSSSATPASCLSTTSVPRSSFVHVPAVKPVVRSVTVTPGGSCATRTADTYGSDVPGEPTRELLLRVPLRRGVQAGHAHLTPPLDEDVQLTAQRVDGRCQLRVVGHGTRCEVRPSVLARLAP